MHFETDPAWLDFIRTWAASHDEIAAVWMFGSRVTGERRAKLDPAKIPDLDLAIALYGANTGERAAEWMCESDSWLAELARIIPVHIDLQFHDEATADRVVEWVRDQGVELFRRDAR